VKTQTSYFRWLLALLVLGGCASSSGVPKSDWTGPKTAAPIAREPWQYDNKPAQIIRTPHYLLHTTITDEDVLTRLAQVMEGAYAQYQSFALHSRRRFQAHEMLRPSPSVPSGRTSRESTRGADSAVYLQITRGGYTIGDWFVSYHVRRAFDLLRRGARRLASIRGAEFQRPTAAVSSRRGRRACSSFSSFPRAATCRAGTWP
jgi:hypothetical protein